MTRKFLTIFILFSLLLPGLLLAQSHILKADGSLEQVKKNNREALMTDPMPNLKKSFNRAKLNNPDQILATVDTMTYTDFGVWNTDFGGYGQDVMVQWFIAPADMEILAVAVNCTDDANPNITVKLVNCVWTAEQMATEGAFRLGHYEAIGNGYLDSNPFQDDWTTTGGWVSTPSDPPDDYSAWGSPFGSDLWSDDGDGAPMVTENNDEYEWTQMSALGVPTVTEGTIFGVAMINASTQVDQETTPPVRWGTMASADRGIGAFKYYANGRITYGAEGDWGWWHRNYTWDVAVEVNLTSDRAPVMHEVTVLTTTTLTTDRTVDLVATDDNPAGGNAGIASANLFLSIDGGDFVENAMTGAEPDYTFDIPGQTPGTVVTYYVEVTDVEGNANRTPDITYSIYAKTQNVLFLYNVDDLPDVWAQRFYMGYGGYTPQEIAHDYYSLPGFGTDILADVLAMYDNVIAIDGSYPTYDITGAIYDWIQTGTVANPKRFLYSSQDIGCGLSAGCADISFGAGTLWNDYLGVAALANQDFSDDSPHLPPLVPVADDPVSGWVAAYNAANTTTYHYDSGYEIGFTSYIDNITPVDGGNVVVTFTTLDSVGGTEQTVGVRNNGDGFYAAFLSYDYAATNFRSDFDSTQSTDPGYAWGIKVRNQASEFLEWGGYSDIEVDPEVSPRAYRLSQNYPNPFNPTTTIEYSIPNKAKVTLKVFDIRGREVTTLVNKNEIAGRHTVTFDASEFASGVYFYQLTTNDNQALVKKMMLIK